MSVNCERHSSWDGRTSDNWRLSSAARLVDIAIRTRVLVDGVRRVAQSPELEKDRG
jgi:hypothetical protein